MFSRHWMPDQYIDDDQYWSDNAPKSTKNECLGVIDGCGAGSDEYGVGQRAPGRS